jgi:hypothetical protein
MWTTVHSYLWWWDIYSERRQSLRWKDGRVLPPIWARSTTWWWRTWTILQEPPARRLGSKGRRPEALENMAVFTAFFDSGESTDG